MDKPSQAKDSTFLTPQSHQDMMESLKKSPNKMWIDDGASKQMKADLEQVKREFDKLMTQRRHILTTGEIESEEIYATEDDLQEAQNKIEKGLIEAQKMLEKIKEERAFIRGLPFKVGDAAFHRQLGNVLINGFLLNRGNYENSSYSVTLASGKRGQAGLKDLVPISEATKVLYGR